MNSKRAWGSTKYPKIAKTFQRDGRWIEKPYTTAVLLCACGNKYIKTREPQSACLKCGEKVSK